MLRAHLAFRA